MAKATATIREVKNKVTGLDLSIPSHTVIPGLLSSTIEYHVVAVTNLAVFKSAKHKESDTVQFMVTKRIADFEDLKWDLEGKFPGLSLPYLPKRDLIGDSSVQGKLTLLNRFLNTIAITGKLATSHITLQFLGVNPYKAGKFRAEDGSGEKATQEVDSRYDIFEGDSGEGEKDEKSSHENLFSEEVTGDVEDLFEAVGTKEQGEEDEDDLFSLDTSAARTSGATKLYEAPDLGGAINDEDEDLFLVPGSKVHYTNIALRRGVEEEDSTDLLNVEDDLDKLLSMATEKTAKPAKPAKPSKPAVKEKPKNLPPKPGIKPKLGVKPNVAPKPSQKPNVPAKPKVTVVGKPKQKPKLMEDEDAKKDLFLEESEPDIFVKGSQVSRDTSDMDLFSLATDTSVGLENIDADDIMKYIEKNSEQKDEDLNLFS